MGQTESEKQTMNPGKWVLNLYIVGLLVVGEVYQLSAPNDEEKVPGVVRQQGKWQAWGMRVNWRDTGLGQHPGFVDARKAVEEWYWGSVVKKAEAKTAKLPCAAHANFRPGCSMCEKANK